MIFLTRHSFMPVMHRHDGLQRDSLLEFHTIADPKRLNVHQGNTASSAAQPLAYFDISEINADAGSTNIYPSYQSNPGLTNRPLITPEELNALREIFEMISDSPAGE